MTDETFHCQKKNTEEEDGMSTWEKERTWIIQKCEEQTKQSEPKNKQMRNLIKSEKKQNISENEQKNKQTNKHRRQKN